MSRDWQRIWWKHLGRGQLSVVTVRDEREVLRGIGPWFVEQEGERRVVRIIGSTEVVDYLDILTTPGCEREVLTALLEFMLSQEAPAWDALDFCNIPPSSPALALLPELARTKGLTVVVTPLEECPVINLPSSYEEYLATLDKKQRHELRRKRRRAQEMQVSWYIVGPEHDLDAEIEAFLELMAMSTTDKYAFLKLPGHLSFFKEIGPAMFEKGILELSFLTLGGRRAASLWQFAYRDRMMLYNSGLNPLDFPGLSPGVVLLTYSIENAIQRHFRVYDFLRGNEEYKYRMGAQRTNVYNIVIHR
jgi:CelD/BcsL family acetyltransferase involved in cellulose biosynthesis